MQPKQVGKRVAPKTVATPVTVRKAVSPTEELEDALASVTAQKQEAAQKQETMQKQGQQMEQKQPQMAKQCEAVMKQSKETTKKKPMHKFGFRKFALALVFATVAVVAIVYLANTNTATSELKVAAVQTGVNGKVYPDYVPRDYTLSSFDAQGGKMTLLFENSTTGESFTLSSENSNYTVDNLYEKYVKSNLSNNGYTTIKEGGLVIYMDNMNACWVKGNVLYRIKMLDGTQLTKKQITTIATSL